MEAELLEKFSRIKLLLMDCDGVMTDGRINICDDGTEFKSFDVKDGMGITLLHQAGIKTGVISGRVSAALVKRAKELSMTYVKQGISDKKVALQEILFASQLSPHNVCYVGDDTNDLCLVKEVALFVAVGDAIEDVKKKSAYVCHHGGGRGAIRELAGIILRI